MSEPVNETPAIVPGTVRHSSTFVRLRHSDNPAPCPHEWEFHLWDQGEAYCHGCGSFAKCSNHPYRTEPKP